MVGSNADLSPGSLQLGSQRLAGTVKDDLSRNNFDEYSRTTCSKWMDGERSRHIMRK